MYCGNCGERRSLCEGVGVLVGMGIGGLNDGENGGDDGDGGGGVGGAGG